TQSEPAAQARTSKSKPYLRCGLQLHFPRITFAWPVSIQVVRPRTGNRMADPLHSLIQRLRTAGDAEPLGDAELLGRFVRGRDAAAFEVLVWRHGAMVLGAARRLLDNDADAEDAFQA